MADRRRVTVADQPLVASSRALQPAPTDLYDRNDLLVQYESWQDEAWAFYETLGEFAYGTTWRANMLSRVRLLAAEKMPGGDEPAPLDGGPAVELINDLGGLDGSTNELMKAFGLHLGVPGDSWLVGEELVPGVRDWSVKSALEVKLAPQSGNDGQPRYQIKENERRWRLLPAEAAVLQIWDPDPRLSYRPYSLAKPALPVMRKIDLYDRHIVATLVSRLAMNGFLMIPEELSFPVRDEYATAADPFVAELIDFAAKAIKNPGTASAAIPFPIKGKAQYLEQFRHLAIANGVDEQLLKARDAELTRLARTLQIPEEVLTGMGEVNHWCVDDQTEILTQEGWVAQDQLQAGTQVLTLNHRTGVSEWQPVQDIYRAQVTDLPMVQMSTRNHDSLTTMDHRWPVVGPTGVRSFKTTRELGPYHRVTTGATHADLPAEAKWSDDLVELVGWFWTEGSINSAGSGVMIAQSPAVNPDQEARIRACLTRLYGPAAPSLLRLGRAGWREKTQHSKVSGRPVTLFYLNKDAAAPLLDIAPGKHVRLEFIRALTASQLELFIRISMMGDGRHRAGRDLTQRVQSRIDALEYAAILSGRTTVRSSYLGGTGGPDGGPVSHHAISFWSQTQIRPVKAAYESTRVGSDGARITQVSYTGTIWCPVTANRTWLARRNGKVFYTGNSAWQLEEQTIKTSICPITEVITSGLTRSYLRPMLQLGGDSLTGPNGGAIIAWYDVSELTAKPDRSREAIELYDRNEIKGETLRREVGFDEADAPADNELANQILKWMAHQVQTSPAALQELTGVQLEVAPTPTSQGAPPGGSTPPGVSPPGGRPGAPRLPMRSPPATQRDRPAAGQPALTAAVGTNGHNGRDPNDNDMRRFRELFGPPGGGP